MERNIENLWKEHFGHNIYETEYRGKSINFHADNTTDQNIIVAISYFQLA